MSCSNCDGPAPDSEGAVHPHIFADSIIKPVKIAMTRDQVEALRANPSAASLFAGNIPLINHGGRTIAKGGKVFNVYLDTVMSFDTADFDAFTKALGENGYLRMPTGEAVTVTFLGSTRVAWPFASKSVTDADLANWIAAHVGRGSIPGADDFTQFSLIMPAGTTVTESNSQSCRDFCGYHVKNGVYYQIIDDSSCQGCNPGVPNEGRMMIQAHEIAEWITDPDGNAWFDANGWENADKCAWQRVAWGPSGKGWVVQPYAMQDGSCFTGPYVESSPPPPPPPPPAPKSVAMQIAPVGDAVVGVLTPNITVTMLDSTGHINVDDNGTVVTLSIPGFTKNTRTALSVAGVVTFTGDVFGSAHNILWYNATASGLPLAMSNIFKVSSVPTPPPPPPPPPVPGPKTETETYVMHVYSDGTADFERTK